MEPCRREVVSINADTVTLAKNLPNENIRRGQNMRILHFLGRWILRLLILYCVALLLIYTHKFFGHNTKFSVEKCIVCPIILG